MLYKIFLLGVIIFSSISIGNIIVGEKEQRLKALSELENCIKAMRNGMVYQGMTFYEALKHTGRVGLNGFFGNCAEILRQHPEWEARQVYDQALKEPGKRWDICRNRKRRRCGIFLCVSPQRWWWNRFPMPPRFFSVSSI